MLQRLLPIGCVIGTKASVFLALKDSPTAETQQHWLIECVWLEGTDSLGGSVVGCGSLLHTAIQLPLHWAK
jgi:hypothetical protein